MRGASRPPRSVDGQAWEAQGTVALQRRSDRRMAAWVRVLAVALPLWLEALLTVARVLPGTAESGGQGGLSRGGGAADARAGAADPAHRPRPRPPRGRPHGPQPGRRN